MNATALTTSTWIGLAKFSSSADDHMGSEQLAWDHIALSQVLLPSLCAIFITVVVVVIACCLIQRKAKGVDQHYKEKSCLTIDTSSHETWEGGIYDVIDEVTVGGLTFSAMRTSQRQEQTGSAPTWSHAQAAGPGGMEFHSPTPAPSNGSLLKSATPTAPDPRRPDTGHLDREQGQQPASGRSDLNKSHDPYNEEEEGIYETLDRYWTFKNATVSGKGSVQQSSSPTRGVIHGRGVDKPGTPATDRADVGNTAGSGDRALTDKPTCRFSRSDCRSPPLPPAHPPGHSEPETMLCQIRLLTVSSSRPGPDLLHSAIYFVQVQQPALTNVRSQTISALLPQSGSLRISSEPSPECNAWRKKGPDLILKPVQGKELQKHVQFADSPAQKEPKHNGGLRGAAKIYEKPYSSKRTPILLAKKSESFRDATSEMKAMKDHVHVYRRSSDSGHADIRQPRDQVLCNGSNAPAEVEVKRILTKLGPLPPLPPQSEAASSADGNSDGKKTEISEKLLVKSPPLSKPWPLSDTATGESRPGDLIIWHSPRSEGKCVSSAGPAHSPPLLCRTLDLSPSSTPPQSLSARPGTSDPLRLCSKAIGADERRMERCASSIGAHDDVRNNIVINAGVNLSAGRGRRCEKEEGGEQEKEREEEGCDGGDESRHYFELEPCSGSADSCTSSDDDSEDGDGDGDGCEDDVRPRMLQTFCPQLQMEREGESV